MLWAVSPPEGVHERPTAERFEGGVRAEGKEMKGGLRSCAEMREDVVNVQTARREVLSSEGVGMFVFWREERCGEMCVTEGDRRYSLCI